MIKSKKTQVGDFVFVFICLIVILICLIPMLNLAARSVSSTEALVKGQVTIYPKGLNFSAYEYVFSNAKYVRSFIWTIVLTLICTVVSLTMTAICAYPLIYEKLRGRKLINIMITITMFFNAGLIPNYLLMKRLGLLNNPLVLIVPSCLSVFNMIIMRSFFYGIPESLRESAEIDGASCFRVLLRIYIPLSKPVFATLALFYAVGRWNGYSDALMYINNKRQDLYPLQYYLYTILKSQSDITAQEGFSTPGLSESIKSAIVMFSTVPILIVYPFLQRYFIHGVTLGAVKE